MKPEILFTSLLIALALAAAPELRADAAGDAISRIDELVLKGLEKEKLSPNAPVSDEVFVRRIHLDLIGRIPTKAETVAFLESKDPDKRANLIDSLIGGDGYVSHTYNWYADILRMRTSISGNGQSIGAGLAYERWLKNKIRDNRPYDEIVRELVTASGSSWENPAIGYYLRDFGMSLDNLAVTTQIFLGTQIVCAQCHNHPFDSWTQMDYYHLSAFTYGMNGTNGAPVQTQAFEMLEKAQSATNAGGKKGGKGKAKGDAKGKGGANPETAALRKAASEILFPLRFNNVVATDRALRLPKDYQYDDARPLSVVKPGVLFGPEAVLSDSSHPIEAFGEWLTAPENPRFAKTMVNRLWKRSFGLGLVEPVDDFKEHTTAANPELMTYLEQLFISLDFDIQAMQRILFNTQAYQREATLEEAVPGAPYHFAGPILRRMSAEQIWDSLVSMTIEACDSPDPARDLYADKKLAEVQLIAESVYDQKPGEFLKNTRKVLQIQEELAVRIEAAEAKVAEAREKGDPSLIKAASAEARAIKNELDARIEETVYREGLAKKLAALSSPTLIEPASLTADDGGGPAPGEHLVDALAATLSEGNRTFDQGMTEIAEGSRKGMVAELITAMFAERDAALKASRNERRQGEQVKWNVKGREEKTSYRNFDGIIRERMQRASEINQPAPAGHFLREFGQSDRELVENSSDQATVTQALAMLNGPALSAVTNRYSVLMRDMRGEDFEGRLDTIYLTMLSRLPTPEERAIFKEAWAADPETGTVTGLVWTVLNTRQFLFVQ